MSRIVLILLLVCGMVGVTMSVLAQEEAGNTAPVASVPMGAGDEETDIVAGNITAVDAAGNTVTVADEAGKSYTLTATKEETSIWKGDNTIELPEVKVDDSVELEYYKNQEGKLVAIWIDVLIKEAAAPAEAVAPEVPAEPVE
jgi:hypothetical protein